MRFLKPLSAALGLALLTLPVMAQVEALTMSNLTVTRYDTLPNIDTDVASACCAPHVYESGAEFDFVYLDLDFAVAWSEDLERINISSRDVTLQLPNETDARQAWARINQFPEIERGGAGLTARRPRDWPEEDAGAYLNIIYLVPAGASAATLNIGEGEDLLQIPVDLPGPVSEIPNAASFYDIKITGMSSTSELLTEDRLSREEIAGRITPMEGTNIVRLEVEVTPSVNARTDVEPGEHQVFFRNTAFALVGPEGLPLLPLGRSVGDSLRNNYSSSASWVGDEGGPTIELTLFFLGSGAAGDYRLFFYNQPVGDAALQ